MGGRGGPDEHSLESSILKMVKVYFITQPIDVYIISVI